jgi:hypothetical protein
MSSDTLTVWMKDNFVPKVGYYPSNIILVNGWMYGLLRLGLKLKTSFMRGGGGEHDPYS